MRSKEGGVMSLEEERAAEIEPDYTEEELATSHGKIRVVKQVPESDEGTYDPETKEVIRFHRGEQEQGRKAA
ncbi:MAG: hypothetical protein ABSE91_01045 [Patescibacteria group bacterium]|jgi:hypothetical protein